MKHQFELLLEVRWHLFRNALRTQRKKFELAARVLLGILSALIAAGMGAGLGVAVYAVLAADRKLPNAPAIISLVLWWVFVAWQSAPLFLEGASPGLNFREIARYPVSFRLYCFLNTLYGLFDPAVLLSMVWLACIWLGIVSARPGWATRAAVALLVFAAVSLLLSRVIFNFAEQVLATRRGKERAVGVLLALLMGSQLVLYVAVPRLAKSHAEQAATVFDRVNSIFPPGLANRVILPRGPGDPARPLALFAAYAGVAALLLRRQLWRIYRGEVISERWLASGAVQVQPGWRFPRLRGPTAAALEKEVRYALRDSRAIMGFLGAPIFAAVATLSSGVAQKMFSEGLKMNPANVYPILAGYALLMLAPLSYNCFAYESWGFQRWLLAPEHPKTVFAVKNAVLLVLLALNLAVVTLLLAPTAGFTWRSVPLVAAGFVFAALALIGSGNLFSVWFPARIEYGTLSAPKVSELSLLLGLLSQATILACFGLVFYFASRWQLDRLPLLAFPVLILGALKYYLFSLDYASGYVREHSEDIASALT